MDSHFNEFIEPWLKQEPLLAIAARFASDPSAWLARVILIEELGQAMFGLSQLNIAHNKLNWWWEEATRCVQNTPSHPLSIQAGGNPRAMAALCEAALTWLDQPHVNDAAQLDQLWREFSQAASAWVGEGDSSPIWSALARKRQLQYHAKPDRYGPSFCDRARLAEFQLRLSELADRAKAQLVLQSLLQDYAGSLRMAACQAGPRSGARAYASLQSEQANAWAAGTAEFRSSPPTVTATIRAWWRARGR